MLGILVLGVARRCLCCGRWGLSVAAFTFGCQYGLGSGLVDRWSFVDRMFLWSGSHVPGVFLASWIKQGLGE
jgi:hypothetical protein